MSRELRPAKRLINSNFGGYKLDSNGLKQFSKPLVTKVHNVIRDPNKFTFNYIKQQLMHNNLFYNQWDDSVYFVDENYNITLIESENNDFSFQDVFKFEEEDEDIPAKFSSSLSFPTESVCIATAGAGILYLIDIHKGSNPKRWRSLATGPIHDFHTPVSILNSYLDLSTNLIHLLVMSLKDFEVEEGKPPVTHALVHWLQISHNKTDTVECSVRNWKTFKGRCLPRDCWLSDDYTELFVVSENEFELVNVVTYESIKSKDSSEEDVIKYYHWHQCKELLTIIFDVSTSQDEIECDILYNNISIKLKSGQVLLEGTLEKPILQDASKWYIHNGKLEVALVKKTAGEFWTNVIPNEKHGVHDIDGEELERINQIHDQLEHLTSDGITKEESQTKQFNIQQMEDCDENLDEEVKVYSIDVLTGKVKLETTLGGQMLFSTLARQDGVPHICLRHDVDGIIWQPSRERTAFWVHVATLDAFGYVLASKPEHKYVGCGPNLEYAVITDCKSNMYIYECKKETLNRRAQYVASFKDCEEILGCVIGKNAIYVLTDTNVSILQLPTNENDESIDK